MTMPITAPAPPPLNPVRQPPTVWSPEHCRAFPAEWIPSMREQVQFLDGVPSVHGAVDQLNRGYIQCPQGICAVYSMHHGTPYLLYRRDTAPYANELWRNMHRNLGIWRPRSASRSQSRPRSASRSQSRPHLDTLSHTLDHTHGRPDTPVRGRPDTPVVLHPATLNALSHSQSRASNIGISPVGSLQLPISPRHQSGSGTPRASFDYEPPRSHGSDRSGSPRRGNSGLSSPFRHRGVREFLFGTPGSPRSRY